MSAFRSNGKGSVESTHVLWLVTFTATRDHVRHYILDRTTAATAETGEKCFSRVVLPTKRTGEPLGFAFVWITSEACFKWILAQTSSPTFQLTPGEVGYAKDLSARGHTFDQKFGSFSEEGVFDPQVQASCANIFELEDKKSNHALYARDPLPEWFTLALLLKEAACYATRGTVRVTKTRGKNPRALIIYDPRSYDGLFAYQMMHIFRVTRPGFPYIFADIVFEHAWKSDLE